MKLQLCNKAAKFKFTVQLKAFHLNRKHHSEIGVGEFTNKLEFIVVEQFTIQHILLEILLTTQNLPF